MAVEPFLSPAVRGRKEGNANVEERLSAFDLRSNFAARNVHKCAMTARLIHERSST